MGIEVVVIWAFEWLGTVNYLISMRIITAWDSIGNGIVFCCEGSW